jgi:transposase
VGDRRALAATPPRPPYGGRHRALPDRNCFAAIIYMARTSTPWRLLPARELGCGWPATAWRRLDEWARAGVFDQLHLDVLDPLGEQGRLDWTRASVDSASVRAKRGGSFGANPVDRGKRGSKLHLVCDGQGLPLAAAVTAANVADVTMLQAMVDDIPPIRTPSGGDAPGQGRSTRIRAMTAPPTGPGCGGVGSGRGSLAVGWSRRRGWGGSGGRSSGRCRG